MKRSVDWISTDFESDPLGLVRLSIGQFNKRAQERLTAIEEVKQKLERICPPFNGNGTILPSMCREAGNALSELRDRVNKFCELLDESSRLPIILTALRYDLLYELCLIKEYVRKLEELIESYCIECLSSLSYSSRKQIYDAFQKVFQQISHTSKQVTSQSEIARFRKRELFSLIEDS